MNYRKVLLLLLVLLLLPLTFKLRGEDFGQAQSLFTDIKANRVGDILTVIISEQSRASNQVETKTEKASKYSTNGGPGLGPLDFVTTFGAEAEAKSNHDGKGENLRNGSLRAKMSVTVVDLKSNGDLVIEGSRTVGVSGDKEVLTLTGVVRQRDISPDNTIDSYLIADADINNTGRGATSTAARPGFLTRFINWLF
ncbi:MAG: flagellar basal body L-ring protein FlgH [candidate division Zixibacteria bacterium]|nr:flagellar basal body L-ring protein FlgH [candidate division Zixibacteria bacterium]